MKRIAGLSVAVVALGALVWLGNNLWAQNAGGMPQAPQVTKLAVINMYVIMKGYKKVDMYRAELQKLAEPFEKKDKELRDNMKGWQTVAQDPKHSKEKRDEAEKHVTTLKRLLEDNGNEATKIIGAKQEQQIIQMFHEIEDAVKHYARANGIHVVLHHNEPVNQTEVYSAANIQRKMKGVGMSGSVGALYVADGLDISQAIVSMLNARFPGAGTAAPTGQ